MGNKRNLSRILHAVHCEPWIIRPAMHQIIASIVEQHAAGTADHAEIEKQFPPMEPPMMQISDGVAVIPIHGVIGKGIGALERMSGAADVEDIDAMVDEAFEDDEIKGVVLDINSPGGTVAGVPEMADKILALSKIKTVAAWTDEMAASAAYWLGSQAEIFAATPSATIGSIGVYLPVMDNHMQLAANGIEQKMFRAGKYKGAGMPGMALTLDQQIALQKRVDEIHAMFKGAVRAQGRKIDDSSMEGQDFLGAEALDRRLIDDLSDSLASVCNMVRKIES